MKKKKQPPVSFEEIVRIFGPDPSAPPSVLPKFKTMKEILDDYLNDESEEPPPSETPS